MNAHAAAGHERTRRLALSTAAFGAATALSRLAGLVREAVAAALLGSGPAMSAFQIAFNVPNLVRTLVADNALSAALVPVFVELRERGREPEAWRVASIVLWLTALVLGALSALLVLLAPLLMPLLMVGQENVSTDLVVSLSRWLFPIVVLLGLTGIVTGILNSYEIFGVPAVSPVAWNAVIVGALLLFHRHGADGAQVYAAAVLVATVVQLLIPLPLLRGRGSGIAFAISFGNPEVRRIVRLMLPVSLGLGLINVNLTIDLLVGSHASSHAVSDLNFAFRLFMLPQGLFSVAVASVLFPEIARLAARGDAAGFTRRVADGSRTIVFLLLPAAALSAALAAPIVRLLYQRGAFGADDTRHVAATLAAFSLGLVWNGLALLLTRAFFARQEPGVPTRVAVANLVLNVVLDLALYRPLGAAGIALATSLVTLWNALALAVLLRRRTGSLHGRELLGESARIAVATAYCAGAAFGVWWPLDQLLGRSLAAQCVSLALGFAAGGLAYAAAGHMLRLADVGVLRTLAPGRRAGRRTGAPPQ